MRINKFLNISAILLIIVSSAFAYSPGPTVLSQDDLTVELPVPKRTTVPAKTLTLQDAILLALRNNPNVRSAEIQRVADKFALEVAHNQFEPQFSIGGSSTYANGSTPQYNFNTTGNWLAPTGAQVQINYDSTFQGPSSSDVTTTITQPLLKGFGPQVTLAPWVLAKYTEQVNRLNLKNTIINTITQVISSYYALVEAYNALTINQIALQNSLVTLRQYQVKIQAGQAAPAEIAQQQAQVANQRLAVTQARNAIAQNYQALLTALGLDPRSKLNIDRNIHLPNLAIPGVEQSIDLALDNNIAYQQGLYALKQGETNLMLAKDQQRWQLNAVATNAFIPGVNSSNAVVPNVNGPGTLVVVPNSGSSSSLTLNLNIPINNKQIKQQLVNATVSLYQQRIQVSEIKRQLRGTILNAIQNLQFQLQQIILAERSVQYAQQALDVELTKLKYGRSTLFEVTQLRTNLTSVQLNLVAQRINYINTLAAFQQTLGVTLDKWGLTICY